MRILLVSALLLVFVSSQLSAADVNGDGGERILLPFSFVRDDLGGQVIRGAFGTIWSGEVLIDNRNPTHVQWSNCDPMLCGAVPPGSMGYVGSPLGTRPDVGQFLELSADQAAHVTFSNRMFERTMRSQPRGIDVPVVREHEFFSRPVTFLGVPSDAGVRIGIRVYDPWAVPPARPILPRLETVVVEILDVEQHVIGTFSLDPEIVYRDSGADDSRVGFAAVTDLATLVPAVHSQGRIHIRVTPNPSGGQYWAMVSVTDNETQTVSLITAQ